jgi:hypothetical protein
VVLGAQHREQLAGGVGGIIAPPFHGIDAVHQAAQPLHDNEIACTTGEWS